MTGIPCPLQLFQRVIAANLHRALGGDGAFDIGVLDFIARRPVKPRSPAGLHRAAAEGLDSVAVGDIDGIQLVHIGPPIFKG